MAIKKSWLTSANQPGCGFPLDNLPACVFRARGQTGAHRIGVGIGDSILDLPAALDAGMLRNLPGDLVTALRQPVLNDYFALGRQASTALREALQAMLREGSDQETGCRPLLVKQADAAFGLPARVGDYTDFFTSFNHAFNVGTLFRPDNPVFANFAALPVAYHGRSSSLAVSGAVACRPNGQYRASHHGDEIVFGPTRRLDFEMELGAYIGRGNRRGQSIAVDAADSHIAGLCVLNDWSARDIQAWESQPLGPFLGKNFLTSVSPWVVSLDALEPYRTAAAPRRAHDGPLQPYLQHSTSSPLPGLEIHTEVTLQSARMRREGHPPTVIARALFNRDTSWTFAQMVAHHTVNGCNLRPGDLLGSGTISGPSPGTQGCLLELTQGGKIPLQLPGGEMRTFLEDGDEVILTAFCERPGLPRIGFGECRGRVAADSQEAD